MRSLIKFAWDFQDNDVRDNDDMLVGGPKWLETERFDIVARPAAPATPSGPHAAVDVVAVGAMLRALLVDRFKLATHSDEQPVWVYAMVADSPKLKRADSTNRPWCRNAPAPPGKTNAPGPVFSLVCQNLTMAQLAERLQPMGGIYVPHPVVDLTGLQGPGTSLSAGARRTCSGAAEVAIGRRVSQRPPRMQPQIRMAVSPLLRRLTGSLG